MGQVESWGEDWERATIRSDAFKAMRLLAESYGVGIGELETLARLAYQAGKELSAKEDQRA